MSTPDLPLSDPESPVDLEREKAENEEATRKIQSFMEERGGSIHPALDAQNQSLPRARSRTKRNTYAFRESTFAQTEHFKLLVEEYQDKSQDPSIRALDIQKKNSWDDAMRAARKAEEKYVLAGEAGARKWSRKITDKATIALPYVRMIPNDMFFSVLSGGLRLVFEAASKISERREQVLISMFRIPEIILLAEDACANFGPDETLYAKAENLYVAALDSIEDIVRWLNKKAAGKPLSAIFSGPTYSKSFKDKMESLDQALNALENHVKSLRDGVICRTEAGVRNLDERIASLEERQEARNKAMEERQEANNKAMEEVSKSAIEQMKEILADRTRHARWMQKKNKEIIRLQLQIKEMEQAASALTVEELHSILDVDSNHPSNDLSHVVRHTDLDSPESQVALSIICCEKFGEWQSDNTSTALFIEGGLSISTRRVSPMSLVSSNVIENYQDCQHAAVIYFFCGHHTVSSDPLYGPLGLIRSLISQVLRLFSVNLDFVSARVRPLIEKLSFRDLCDCFSKIVKQLKPSTVLFCVIDGISFLEKQRSHQMEDCSKVIGDLRDLVYDTDTHLIFKLLVTSPARSKHIMDIFEPEDQLSLLQDASRRQASERHIQSARKRAPPVRQRRSSLQSALQAQDLYTVMQEYGIDSFSESE